MKLLPIRDAIQLYSLLEPYIPEELGDTLNFVGTIVNNIKNSGNHRVYIEAVSILSGLEFDEILQYDPVREVLPMFAEGLTVNQFSDLVTFCKEAGIHG